jgi:hypothetical protein
MLQTHGSFLSLALKKQRAAHLGIYEFRVSILVSSYRPSLNLESTQETTCTISCLVSRLVDLYHSLIYAYKKEYYNLQDNNN